MSIVQGFNSYIVEPYRIESHDCRKEDGVLPTIHIGNHCSIGSNCTFILSHHYTNRVSTSASPYSISSHGLGNTSSYSKGDIIIKNDVWIGTNCTILDGLIIGNGAVIAAGAVVVKSVPPYAIVGGNPAKHLRYRFSEEIIKQLEELQFWELDEKDVRKFDIWSEDIEAFISDVREFKKFKREQLSDLSK